MQRLRRMPLQGFLHPREQLHDPDGGTEQALRDLKGLPEEETGMPGPDHRRGRNDAPDEPQHPGGRFVQRDKGRDGIPKIPEPGKEECTCGKHHCGNGPEHQ